VDLRALEARQRRVLSTVLIINAVTFVMMVGAAFYTGSSSLLSGGLDNLGGGCNRGQSYRETT